MAGSRKSDYETGIVLGKHLYCWVPGLSRDQLARKLEGPRPPSQALIDGLYEGYTSVPQRRDTVEHYADYENLMFTGMFPGLDESIEEVKKTMAATKNAVTSDVLEQRRQAAKASQGKQSKGSRGGSRPELKKYVNEVTFTGRLGKDPDVQFTPTGKELQKASFAVFNPGDKEHDTNWFDLEIWLNEGDDDDNSDLYNQFARLAKGQEVVITGRLKSLVWSGKDGNDHTKWIISVTGIQD